MDFFLQNNITALDLRIYIIPLSFFAIPRSHISYILTLEHTFYSNHTADWQHLTFVSSPINKGKITVNCDYLKMATAPRG